MKFFRIEPLPDEPWFRTPASLPARDCWAWVQVRPGSLAARATESHVPWR